MSTETLKLISTAAGQLLRTEGRVLKSRESVERCQCLIKESTVRLHKMEARLRLKLGEVNRSKRNSDRADQSLLKYARDRCSRSQQLNDYITLQEVRYFTAEDLFINQ
jgi:hypothetical protein